MMADPPNRLRRLAWHLPLSIAGLLALAVSAVSWMAYRNVRAAALVAGADRLEVSAGQIAGLIGGDPSNEELLALASNPAVVAALREPGPGTLGAARDTLAAALSDDNTRAAALLTASGTLVVEAEAQPSADVPAAPDPARPDFSLPDSVAIGGFTEANGAVWFDESAPVTVGDTLLGHVVVTNLVSSDEELVRNLSDLIAPGARFILGERGGTWTDLLGPAEPPPEAALAAPSGTVYTSSRGALVLGHGVPVPSTPWMVWVEAPAEPILALARDFLRRIAPVGLLVVLAGAIGGVALSRRITRRLGEVRSAATAIASGAYDRRAPVGSYLELDQLALAFNFMAEQVGDAQGKLEEQIAVRTAALEAREAEFRMLATTAPDAIVTADDAGRITYFNPGAERIFGRSADEAVGQPLTILMPERFHEAHHRGFSSYAEAGDGSNPRAPRELVGRRRDGLEFPVELAIAGHRYDGRLTFTGIIRDITDRKRRDEAVARYSSELEAANKELEAFSYSVSHDLRAPLRAIHGFSQALTEDYEDRLDEQGVRLLGRVRAAAQRMGQLIDDLLELSRATRAEMQRERVDLTEMSRRIADDLRATEPDRDVRVDVAEGLVAMADPQLIRLVLGNLIGNAWKFAGKLEHAVVQVGRSDEGEFFVRDNGAGFDMAYVDQLFRPFQRLHADSEFRGTGVGLALVQRIVHRHGGSVRAEGVVGEGATFYFTMPAKSQHPGRLET